jgi:TonB-linked SusC/RagA family outer membrane protein
MLSGFCMAVSAQNRTVKGRIVDEQNEELAGATVQLKGTNAAAVSNATGEYTLTVPSGSKNPVLVFSYVGFLPQEIPLKTQTVINVTMQENLIELGEAEVIYVGYGTQGKASMTGAVAHIDNKNIVTTKSTNVQNALTGKIAGVKVVEETSEPGVFETDFSIRGQGTPLIVIDGVPRDNMTRLDPNEVESMTMLKDASAAVYGARAANGVVLITTKQGQRDTKFKFEYTGYLGSESFIKDMKTLNVLDFMRLHNERVYNMGLTVIPYGRSRFDAYEEGRQTATDWMSPFINEHPLATQHSLNASGGTKALSYFVNFGYTNREGRWESDATYYHRYNLRSNVTAQLARGLEAKINLNLMQEQTRSQVGSTYRIYDYMVRQLPTDNYYLPDPVTGEPSTDYPYNTPSSINPAMVLDPDKAGYDLYAQRLVQTNMSLTWDIPRVQGLKLGGMYSFDFRDDDTKAVRKMYTVYDVFYSTFPAGDHFIRRDDVKYLNDLLQVSLTWKRDFDNKTHNAGVSLFYEESSRRRDNFWVRRETIFPSIEELFAGKNTGIQGTQEKGLRDVYHHANKAVIGRASYNYRLRYIADFSFRYDGSSKFGPGYQWGFFPVGSLGWVLSEEPFIKNSSALSFLSNLKIRGSYGIMGDDSSSSFQFVSGYEYPTTMATNYSDGYYVLESDGALSPTAGVRTLRTPNRVITWFTSRTLNLGLDFEIRNGLLGGVVEVFQRNRSGLMATRELTLPKEAGITLPDENLNSDLTRGFEFTLTHRNKIDRFRYNVSGYISMDRTMDLYVERADPISPYDNWKNNMNNRWGMPNFNPDTFRKRYAKPNENMYWGVDYKGQFQSMDEIFNDDVVYDSAGNAYLLPGDLRYEDWNHDGMIDDQDEHPIGSKHTTISYGFTLSGEYRGFDLSCTLQGTAGNRRYLTDISDYFRTSIGALGSGLSEFADRWHRADEFNPSNYQDWVPGYYPSTFAEVPNRNTVQQRMSTFWVVDASFLRAKSLEAGYTLPAAITKKVEIQRARIFVNGYNMFTFSKLRTVDPEQSGVYPLVKSYNVGINVTF